MRERLAPLLTALVGAILVVPATYALLRGYDALFVPQANPATLVSEVHVAMFWRVAVGAFVAGMAAPLVYVCGRRDLQKTLRVLHLAVLVVGAALFAQGTLLP